MDTTPTEALPPEVEPALETWIAEGRIELPSLPHVAAQVISLTFDEDCDLAGVEKVVSQDPHIAGQVLRHANSALFAPAVVIQSLARALSHLGMGRIRDVALKVSCESRVFKCDAYATEAAALLEHAKMTAVLARHIASRVSLSSDEAFLLGLLHDVGRPVLLQTLADLIPVLRVKLKRRLQIDGETAMALIDRYHETVAAELLRAWGMPASLGEALSHHHDPGSLEDPEVAKLMWVVRLADGIDEEGDDVAAEAASALGLGASEVDEIRGRLDELRDMALSI